MKSANVDNILIIALKNNNDYKFKVADHVGILKYGIFLQKITLKVGRKKIFKLRKSNHSPMDICY